MRHAHKVRLARKLRTVDEKRSAVNLFHSRRWLVRKWQIRERVRRQEIRRKYHKEVKQGVR